MPDAELPGRVAAQEVGDELRVEVPRVPGRPPPVQPARTAPGVHEGRLLHACVVERLVGAAVRAAVVPVVRQRDLVDVGQQPERVVELVRAAAEVPRRRLARAVGTPVDELHGHLEAGVALAHPVVLGDAEVVEEGALQIRHGRLPHADARDRRRLQHGDVHRAL